MCSCIRSIPSSPEHGISAHCRVLLDSPGLLMLLVNMLDDDSCWQGGTDCWHAAPLQQISLSLRSAVRKATKPFSVDMEVWHAQPLDAPVLTLNRLVHCFSSCGRSCNSASYTDALSSADGFCPRENCLRHVTVASCNHAPCRHCDLRNPS